MIKYANLYLCLIIGFFLATRLFQITQNPKSLYWDEASIGYNAYSILKTGKDEWGKFMPLHFTAFGEFKLPVYIYATTLFESILGLSELAVRLPALIFSLGSLILVYLIVKQTFKNQTQALFAALFFSCSQWWFIFSRTGYEASGGLMFYLGMIYFWQKLSLSKNWRWLISTLVCMVGSIYSYNSFRILVPLTLPLLVWTFPVKKWLIILSLGLVLAYIPVARLYTNNLGLSRVAQVGLQSKSPIYTFALNYLAHFNPRFLFIQGDSNLRSQLKGFGQLSWIEGGLLILGLILAAKEFSKNWLVIFYLLAIAPIPAAITKEAPHALRAIAMAPLISIIASGGVVALAKLFLPRVVYVGLSTLVILSFAVYFYQFTTSYSIYSAKDWQYAYKALFQTRSDNLAVSDYYAQPYILALFYQKVDPVQFRQTVIYNDPSQWGFSTVKQFGTLKFGRAQELLKSNQPSTLAVEPAVNLGPSIGRVNFPDNTPALLLYQR